jgi:hypothetical protein
MGGKIMLMNKLDRYLDFFNELDKKKIIPFNDVFEKYKNSSDEERIKMLLEMDERNRTKIKAMIDGGLI